jgi:hypothetical protein
MLEPPGVVERINAALPPAVRALASAAPPHSCCLLTQALTGIAARTPLSLSASSACSA